MKRIKSMAMCRSVGEDTNHSLPATTSNVINAHEGTMKTLKL